MHRRNRERWVTRITEALKSGLYAGVAGLALQAACATDVLAQAKSRADLSQVCQSRKLTVVSNYYACLLREGFGAAKRARCDDQFKRTFANADQLSPACPPLDDLDRTQRAVADQANAVLVGDVSAPPCQQVLSGTDGRITCSVHGPGQNIVTSAAILQDILQQIQTQDPSTCPACASVTINTPVWLQAWGGGGGTRGGEGVSGGNPGFAQMVTTISQLEEQGTLVLYFYLGGEGGYNATSGASGGASTLVTTEDLQSAPTSNPSDALLIAGGGGGSGGCDSGCIGGCAPPGSGGNGGTAISKTGPDGQGIGQGDSGGGGNGGAPGGQSVGGAGVGGGAVGTDGIGGWSGGGGWGAGKHFQPDVGFFNTGATPLTFTNGTGGEGDSDSNSCAAGGGGGGGGWGGGGGGGHGNNNDHAGGGGGGGSYSAASTCMDVAAPTTYVQSPTGGGEFYLVFNAQGSCQ